MLPRGQGAFEYLLMLVGIMLVAVIVIMIMQGSVSQANNTLNQSTSNYDSFITTGITNVLTTGSVAGSVNLSCTVGATTTQNISDNANCALACQNAGYKGGKTVCSSAPEGCAKTCDGCTNISCYGVSWSMMTSCVSAGPCNMDSCNCTH